MSEADRPDILVYPPLMSVLTPGIAAVLEWLAPIPLLPPFFTAWCAALGVTLLAIAGGLAVSGTRAFKAAGTNVDPKTPALRLVETGPYRFTRNPMYLGMVILQLALGFLLSLDWALLFAPALWGALHFSVVLREETYLSRKFGPPYDEYLGRTRRWI